MEDIEVEAYLKYPQHHNWFNKLWFAEQMGYECGPAGIAPKRSGLYIVRPIMNLRGMGLNAEKVYINSKDGYKVGASGTFWCEWFVGRQFSVDYEWNKDHWKQTSCFEGIRDEDNLSRFKRWRHVERFIPAPGITNELADVEHINIEFIENNPIEVHLRKTPYPQSQYHEFIPVWDDERFDVAKYEKMGYTFVSRYEDCGGHLTVARIGFMVKKEDKITNE